MGVTAPSVSQAPGPWHLDLAYGCQVKFFHGEFMSLYFASAHCHFHRPPGHCSSISATSGMLPRSCICRSHLCTPSTAQEVAPYSVGHQAGHRVTSFLLRRCVTSGVAPTAKQALRTPFNPPSGPKQSTTGG